MSAGSEQHAHDSPLIVVMNIRATPVCRHRNFTVALSWIDSSLFTPAGYFGKKTELIGAKSRFPFLAVATPF